MPGMEPVLINWRIVAQPAQEQDEQLVHVASRVWDAVGM